MSLKQLTVEDYHVACITVLPEEFAAVQQMIDLPHKVPVGIDGRDPNNYEVGQVAGHNVVLCIAAQPGTTKAATTATHLWRSFKKLRFGLLVGIGAGVPSVNRDIFLGDVVVAAPGPLSSGITHYDHGKQLSDAFILLRSPVSTPLELLGAVSRMRSINLLDSSTIPQIISAVVGKYPVFQRPDHQSDLLFQPTYDHVAGNPNCDNCAREHLEERTPRSNRSVPRVHYGPIASGSQVVKSPAKRDYLGTLYGVYCIEMEAAGVMPSLPSFVIRGISDYADSHKNDDWHNYAALAAVAYAKELLTCISPAEPDAISSSPNVSSSGVPGQPTATLSRDVALEGILDDKARRIGATDWRASIVDLLKILGLKWDGKSRDDLAALLQVSEGSSGSARRNNALRRALIGRLAVVNGGVVFPGSLDALRY
ncbi:nucleoside phosphorylase domain-containing protein [Aspergillus venezuelensis]